MTPGRRPALRLRSFALALTAVTTLAAGSSLTAQPPPTVETFDAAWRIVRDSHFDKSMNGVDWDAVAAELRPRAAAATTAGELRAAIGEMLGRLGQSHFTIIPATGEGDRAAGDVSGHPGFDVRLVGRDLLVAHVDAEGGAAAVGVRTGWKVQSVDGSSMTTLVGSLPDALEPHLLHVQAWRLARRRLNGAPGSRASVTFEDGTGRAVTLAVERRPETGQPVTVGNLPTMFVRVENERHRTPSGAAAGLIRFNVWMTAVDPPFAAAVDDFRDAAGMVIDLRGNPGGFAGMLMGISGHFIDERTPLGVMKTRDHELHFNVNPRRVNGRGERVVPFAGPVAILVDALTGSASECFAGGMQSLGRVRVFGQQTMGQALPALFSKLPNGDVLIHAYADFVTSTGTRLEGRGVIPDERIPLDRADLLAGRDRTLEAALAWIDSVEARRRQR